MFDTEKPEWCRYLMVKKFDDMFSSFDTIPPCDRQTDTHTSYDSIDRAMQSRSKKQQVHFRFQSCQTKNV